MLDKGTDIKYLSIGNIIPGQINKDRLTKRNFDFIGSHNLYMMEITKQFQEM